MPQNKSEIQEKKPFKIFIYIIGFMILWMMFIHLESTDNTNLKSNILHFQNNKNLICRTSLGGRASVLASKFIQSNLKQTSSFTGGLPNINISHIS